MPELPEIEIVKRSLFKMVNKAKIVNVKINNKNLRYKIPHTLSKKLVNEKILKISRRSKYLIFHFKNKLLLVHLGMSGKFLIVRNKDNKIFKTSFYYDLNILAKHNHIYFVLNNGLILIYNDVRRFGFFKIFTYGLLVATGFLVAILLASSRAEKEGLDSQKVLDLCFYVAIFHFGIGQLFLLECV